MREVRPTIKVLKSLPRETFGDGHVLDLIKNRAYGSLELYGVDHPLLADARKRFADGLPDRHNEASKAYGKPVFEVRDHGVGPGWRGAVVLDADGDPWLVWADRHDAFHARVATISFEDMLPTPVEYKLRDREEAAFRTLAWRQDVLTQFIEALQECVRSGAERTVSLPGVEAGPGAELTLAIEHDPVLEVAQAQDGSSLLSVVLRLSKRTPEEIRIAVQSVCLPFLEPDMSKVEPYFGKDGTFNAYVSLTHAQLIQLLADAPTYDETAPETAASPTHLHYVATAFMAAAFVNGDPLRGVCGAWFIPSRGDEAALPICPECEAEMPAAQLVLDLIRRTG